MKVTKHGFTYMDTDDTPVHLCPECQLTMHHIGTTEHTRMILNSIKWDRHYAKYRCDGCGCEGEEYIGRDNLRIRNGLIQLIITSVVSLIIHSLLWYWVFWYDETYHPTASDEVVSVQAGLIVWASVSTILCIVKSLGKLNDDETFIWR